MTDHDHIMRAGDAVMIGSGLGWSLAQWSDFAGELTPILSMVFVALSVLWLFIRIVDRFRFGPGQRRGSE